MTNDGNEIFERDASGYFCGSGDELDSFPILLGLNRGEIGAADENGVLRGVEVGEEVGDVDIVIDCGETSCIDLIIRVKRG